MSSMAPSLALRTLRWPRLGLNRSTSTRSDRQAWQLGQRGRKSVWPKRRQPAIIRPAYSSAVSSETCSYSIRAIWSGR